jgi:YjjW family glycine radical enzyme activase
MAKGLINRIIPFSSVDGPGNRTAVFLQGCNFNCLYCHNPETIKECCHCSACIAACPQAALYIEAGRVFWNRYSCQNCDLCLKSCPNTSSPKALLMDAAEAVKEIKKVRAFISGITVSGGECMLQPEFLAALFSEVRRMNLTIFVDTNGSVPFWDKPELTALMDMAMVDVKAFNSEEHIRLTGMDNVNVLKNVEYLAGIGKLYEIRTVIVPGILDNYYNVQEISKLIASLNSEIRYKLIRYRSLGVRGDIMTSRTPPDAMMDELVQISQANGCKNIVVT